MRRAAREPTKDEDGLDRSTTQLGWAEPDVPGSRGGLEISSPYESPSPFSTVKRISVNIFFYVTFILIRLSVYACDPTTS